MNYLKINYPDIANGEGIRVTLFTSGCEYHCKGCFNPESWDFNAGESFTEKEVDKILNLLSSERVSGLTLLGGEPLHFKNRDVILDLVKKVKEKYPNKTIWAYTGNVIENFLKEEDERIRKILKYVDVLVDGPFIEEMKNLNLQFRGSENQRVIKVPETLETGKVILYSFKNL